MKNSIHKLQKFVLALLVISVFGCAKATIVSNAESVYDLSGKSVLVVTQADKNMQNFANKVTRNLAAVIGDHNVDSYSYIIEDKELELTENPIMDYAKEKNTEYLLSLVMERVHYDYTTTATAAGPIYMGSTSLSSIEFRVELIDIAHKKKIWMADISTTKGMSGYGTMLKKNSQAIIDDLIAKGFIK